MPQTSVSPAHVIQPGDRAPTLLGSSFCTFRNFRILGDPGHHSRSVRVPYHRVCRVKVLNNFLSRSAFSVRSNMNPVSTRIELGCLGLMGTFWIGMSLSWPPAIASLYRCIALGAFLANSDSETASVECFVSATDLTPIDDGCELFGDISPNSSY